MKAFEQRHQVQLEAGQRAPFAGFTNSGRLVVGIGPAGAGKRTAVEAVAETWRTTGARVVPLVPSAAAADVLSTELGCRAENLHMFRHTHDTAPIRRPTNEWFALHPRRPRPRDEAGMAGTRNLDRLTSHAG